MARLFAGAVEGILLDDPLNPSGSFTIFAHCNISIPADFMRLVSNRSDGDGTVGFILGTDSGPDDNNMRFLVAIGGAFRTAGPGATELGSVYHTVCGIYIAAATDIVNLYVDDMDNTEATTSGIFGTYNDATDNLAIGNNPNHADGNQWNGDVGFFAYFDRALSAGERNAVKFLGPRAATQLGAIVNLPILGDESPEPDWSGNGHNGVVTGTTKANNPSTGLWTPQPWAPSASVAESVEPPTPSGLILPEYGQLRTAIGDPPVYGATIHRS